jgi:hypothetical protein
VLRAKGDTIVFTGRDIIEVSKFLSAVMFVNAFSRSPLAERVTFLVPLRFRIASSGRIVGKPEVMGAASWAAFVSIEDKSRGCHENGESAHEKSTTYEQLAIFMLRGVPEAVEKLT